MITVTATDDNPVKVTLIIPGLSVASNIFGGSKVQGKFAQSESDEKIQFLAAYNHKDSNLVIKLTEWTLDVECKLKNNSENRYSCRQFPGPVIPGDARYVIKKGMVQLFLPKADSSQSWAGALTLKGLDQSS